MTQCQLTSAVVVSMTSRHVVQVGERFGRGVVTVTEAVTKEYPSGTKRFRVCTLDCDCGASYQVPARALVAGHTQSCGCLHREVASRHMREVNQAMNAARVQVPVGHPSSATHREAMKVKRFDPADPDYKLRWSLWCRFRITLEEYNAKLAAQGGRCAICRNLPGKTRLHVDHDHRCCPGRNSCGKCNRGLLCFTCNGAVGYRETFGQVIDEYLQEWEVAA